MMGERLFAICHWSFFIVIFFSRNLEGIISIAGPVFQMDGQMTNGK